MPFRMFLTNGEKDDAALNFGGRMQGGQSASGTGWGWWLPAGLSAISSALSASALYVRVQSTAPGYIYVISGYVDLTNGRRLIDEIEVHVG